MWSRSISTGGWRSGESHNLEEWDLLQVSRNCWLIAIWSGYLLPTPDPSFPMRPLLSRHNRRNHLQSVGIIFRGLVDFCRRCVNCPISSRHLSFSVLSCPISSKFLSFSFLSCATTSVLWKSCGSQVLSGTDRDLCRVPEIYPTLTSEMGNRVIWA